MKKELYDILTSFGYPVWLQGTRNPNDPYPESFITYFTNDVADGIHYDNDTKSYVWDFSVIFYSSDPALLNSKPDEIRKKLKDAGFFPQGKGRDIPSDLPSHTGWAMDFYKVEY